MFSVNINEGNFESVMSGDLPVLLQFWSPKCRPCQMVGPAIASLAEDYLGQIWVGKVKVEDNPEIVSQCAVENIPAFSFFHKTVELERLTGSQQYTGLKTFIERNLEKCY